MSAEPEKLPLPNWLLWAGSAVIIFHIVALVVVVLAVPSGPWPSPFGPSNEEAPKFAQELSKVTTQGYLQPLQISSTYHFESNRPDLDSVYFEALLRDAQGKLIQTIRFPEKDTKMWVRSRQAALAQSLGEDVPLQPPRGEIISAPGKEMETVYIWESPESGGPQVLSKIPIIRIPRDRPAFGPSDWSRELARSYARYLGKEHDAASVEIVRHSRRPIFPAFVLTEQGPGPEDLEEMICSFGEYRLEK
jgi:hypothetical protein